MPIRPAFSLIALALLAACVPNRKYEELQTRYRSTQESESAAVAKAQQAEAAMLEQKAAMDDLTARNSNLKRDTTILGTSLRNMTVQYDKINELNQQLLDKYNALMAGDRSENRKLLTDLPDEVAIRVTVIFYADARDALMKALNE